MMEITLILIIKKDSKMKQEKFQEETKALRYIDQGPLITDGRNSCKWTGPTVGLSKSFIRVKISGLNFFKLLSDG